MNKEKITQHHLFNALRDYKIDPSLAFAKDIVSDFVSHFNPDAKEKKCQFIISPYLAKQSAENKGAKHVCRILIGIGINVKGIDFSETFITISYK